MDDIPFIATERYAVDYDCFVHPAIGGRGEEARALERELDEKVAGFLLQEYLRQKAARNPPEPFRAKRRRQKHKQSYGSVFCCKD